MSKNQLSAETSPYLLQHRDDPVHWRAWSDEALHLAHTLDRPVFLSIGYSACHWCHVMARESFSNPGIAALINELFVPIKVDREERPDLDSLYQQALALLGERGGWPLTVFLTPAGELFKGGTYFPPERRWGRPGLPEVLRSVSIEYHQQKTIVGERVADLVGRLRQSPPSKAAVPVDGPALDGWCRDTLAIIDPIHGGIQNPPKFPNCSILELLWRGYLRSGQTALRGAVLNTLTRMCQGGIYDHLGGGFSRYSVDARWLVPHFEKMLYDNAQLIDLLTWAWQENASELYRQRVVETIDWVLRDMTAPGSAFASSVDADSQGEEGRFYVWSQAEIDGLLGADAPLFRQFYDVTPAGNWEKKTVLNRLRNIKGADPATEAVLARSRRILLHARLGRIAPARDDKVLADWNGLMIGALAHASQVFSRNDWLEAAVGSWRFVTTQMRQPDHRLAHSWRMGRGNAGILDDYAAMSRAGLRLHEATNRPEYLEQSKAWIGVLDAHFNDPEGAGYFFTDEAVHNPITRIKSGSDVATPSGNALLVEVLGRLYFLTGECAYHEKAAAILAAFSGAVGQDYLSHAALLNGADLLINPVQIALIGDESSPETGEMLQIIRGSPFLNYVLVVAGDGGVLPPLHPLHGKKSNHGRTAAYICEGASCSLPLASPGLLRERLAAILQNRTSAL
jgi:uncharacterized protein YyaL (SSP411 family)